MLGRNFRLILHPHKEVLHRNFRAYSVDGSGTESIVHLDHDSFFKGRVFGETNSHVNAQLENGILTASVMVPGETYHIEPSWRHLDQLTDRHMIAYKASDIMFSWDDVDAVGGEMGGVPKTCGYIKEGAELEGSGDDGEDEIEGFENMPSVWTAEAEGDDKQVKKIRRKRQADQYEYTPTKTRCPLLLVADYRFFQEMGGSNTKTTINYLVSCD